MSRRNSIITIDGSKDPSFVILRNDDDVHYFYWPYEFNFKIWKNFGFQDNDIEPIKKSGNFILSRFHYHGITIWINSDSHQGNPMCNFFRNFHSPIMIPRNGSMHRILPISRSSNLIDKDISNYLRFRDGFTSLLFSRTSNNPHSYDEFIVQEIGHPVEIHSIPFDADCIRNYALELIVIGSQQEILDLENNLRTNGGGEITPESVIAFFNFQ